MDIEQHIYLRSFSRPASLPIIKSLVFALATHAGFLISWQHNEIKKVAEIPQWINIKLTSGYEEKENKTRKELKKIIPLKKKMAGETFIKKRKQHKLVSKKKTTSRATTFIKADSRPYFLQNPKPVYPAAARRRGMQGVVLLGVKISRDGYVKNIEVLKTSGFKVLDRSAIKSVLLWRFIPAKKGLENVPSEMEIPIRFILKETIVN